MNFIESMQVIYKGGKVRRRSWENKHYYLYMNDKIIIDYNNCWFDKFDIYDYLADDWEVYKESEIDGIKYYNFYEIYKWMKKGLKVSRRSWGKSKFIYIDLLEKMVDQDNKSVTLFIDDLDNEDWYVISGKQ